MKKISLRAKYSFALISIAVYILLFHTTTIDLIKKHDEYMKNIDLVSKERILMVKMLFYADNLYHHENIRYKTLLNEAVNKFNDIEIKLKNNGYIFEENNKKEYIRDIKYFLNSFEKNVDNKLDEEVKRNINDLEKRYDHLIANIDIFASMIQKESQASIEHLIEIKTYLLIFLIILLLFEAFFIFLPTEKEIKTKTKELIDINKELEERILEATRKNEEQALQIAQQSKFAQMGELMNMIAHQWRQPLASISAISGTLSLDTMMDNYKEDFFQQKLNEIDELSNYLSLTIDEFRSFYKNNKELQKGDIKKIVQDSLKIITPSIEAKNIQIDIDIEDNIHVNTYITEIKQVLLNIIKNAEDALLEKELSDAHIWIEGTKSDDHAQLSIEDNAGGIPDDIMNDIFKPYFSTKKDKDGTGLGLYMSKIIIEDHCKGKLEVINGQKGAKFIITIPLESEDTE